MLWRLIGDVLQVQFLLSMGIAGACAGVVAWFLTVLAQMPFWISAILALSTFLIVLAILRTVLPPLFGWAARRFGRDHPAIQPTYRIENHGHMTVQISDSGSNTVSYGSNTIVVTPEGEGPLLPPGSILGRSWAESVKQSDAWKAEVIGPMTVEPIMPPPKDDGST
jgi:hypothetical protein